MSECEHKWSPGYGTIEHGIKVSITRVCYSCPITKTEPYQKEPSKSGLLVKGLSSGERINQ